MQPYGCQPMSPLYRPSDKSHLQESLAININNYINTLNYQ